MIQTLSAPPLARRLGLAAWIGAAALFALPAVAMLLTGEVNWTALDFGVFGGMLALVVLPFQFALRRVRNLAALAGVAVALGTGFLELWANLAVGIVGDSSNRINVLFVAILLVPAIGALIVRGAPRGMARVLLITALLQAAILATLGIIGPERGVWLTGIFVVAWLLSAWLFNRSAHMPDWHSPHA